MSSPLNLQISFEFHESNSDHSNCEECKEMIIGKMFQRVIFVDYEPIYKEKYCTYCYKSEE